MRRAIFCLRIRRPVPPHLFIFKYQRDHDVCRQCWRTLFAASRRAKGK